VVEVVSEQERNIQMIRLKPLKYCKGKQNRDIKTWTALLRQELLIPLL
jgi:hypothetical protein